MESIYLDYNATSGLDLSLVTDDILTLKNPNSVHRSGQSARIAIEEARDALYALTQADRREYEIVFTSGATEASNLFFHWLGTSGSNKAGRSIWLSSIEHAAVLEPCRRLLSLGYSVEEGLPPCSPAVIDSWLSSLEKTIDCFVVQYVNNETGQIVPLADIVKAIRKHAPQALIFSDWSQAIGKIDVSLKATPVDGVILSGHKFGAPAGVGALIIKRSLGLTPVFVGGPQEQSKRAGTENVVGIALLGKAIKKISGAGISERTTAMRSAREAFLHVVDSSLGSRLLHNQKFLSHTFPGSTFLPNTLSLQVPGWNGADLVVALDIAGVQVSSGAACSSGKVTPSHVLTALGFTPQQASESVRVSFGPDITPHIAQEAAEIFCKVVAR